MVKKKKKKDVGEESGKQTSKLTLVTLQLPRVIRFGETEEGTQRI